MEPNCFACQTVHGMKQAPGGVIFENDEWLADHCIGAFGIGSVVIKTKAHRENLWDLTSEESASLGEVIRRVSEAIVHALNAERVYVSLWVDQQPYHVHFVLQPRYRGRTEAGGAKGWKLQLIRLWRGKPNPQEAAIAAQKIRDYLALVK